jgi:UDP-GlcNAc3NAcA epimerase
VRLIEPVGYFDMMVLEENARLIATDSGGVQREAYFFGVPCLTLRDETEWGETVAAGWNVLAGNTPERIAALWRSHVPPAERPPIFGDGTAADAIVKHIETAQPLAFGQGRRRSAVEAADPVA